MPKPDFTPDEQYLVTHLMCLASNSGASYMWGYVSGSALLAVCGLYYDSTEIMLVAFLVLIGFRLYEEHYQKRWVPLWRSIIEKYEAAVNGNATHGLSDQGDPPADRDVTGA